LFQRITTRASDGVPLTSQSTFLPGCAQDIPKQMNVAARLQELTRKAIHRNALHSFPAPRRLTVAVRVIAVRRISVRLDRLPLR
jgi:glycyl-tRNA synthetase beta subunit